MTRELWNQLNTGFICPFLRETFDFFLMKCEEGLGLVKTVPMLESFSDFGVVCWGGGCKSGK